jgi:hypothetical protein
MATPSMPDVLAALKDFVARIDALDPVAAKQELVLELNGRQARLEVSAPVAKALAEALGMYHDPRDLGRCDYCGGPLDANYMCRGCGQANGVFGQLLMERAARHTDLTALPAQDEPGA